MGGDSQPFELSQSFSIKRHIPANIDQDLDSSIELKKRLNSRRRGSRAQQRRELEHGGVRLQKVCFNGMTWGRLTGGGLVVLLLIAPYPLFDVSSVTVSRLIVVIQDPNTERTQTLQFRYELRGSEKSENWK